jgi:hypothetical protein
MGGRRPASADSCTGVATTCDNDECLVCGTRDCPDHEPLHYHHDGCPACDAGIDVRVSGRGNDDTTDR